MEGLRIREGFCRNFVLSAVVVTCVPVDGATPQELSEIRTVSQHSHDGVTSRVALVDRSESRKQLGRTDSAGVLMLQQAEPCHAGMVIEAQPGSAWYKKASKDVACASPEIVELQRVNIRAANHETNNLVRNIDAVAATGDNGLSALLYNDLAVQVAREDEALSRDYAERAAIAWASATDFSGDPFDPRDPRGGGVLTPEFSAHVARYQQSVGLERTGRARLSDSCD